MLLGELTPYEIWTECGPLFCPAIFRRSWSAALKKNIAIALTRANMGVIKNLCGINWIIEPLGAEIRADLSGAEADASGPPPEREPCKVCMTDDIKFEIAHHARLVVGLSAAGDALRSKATSTFRLGGTRAATQPAGLPARSGPGVGGGMHRAIDVTGHLSPDHCEVLLNGNGHFSRRVQQEVLVYSRCCRQPNRRAECQQRLCSVGGISVNLFADGAAVGLHGAHRSRDRSTPSCPNW